jgi:hypothetical protein
MLILRNERGGSVWRQISARRGWRTVVTFEACRIEDLNQEFRGCIWFRHRIHNVSVQRVTDRQTDICLNIMPNLMRSALKTVTWLHTVLMQPFNDTDVIIIALLFLITCNWHVYCVLTFQVFLHVEAAVRKNPVAKNMTTKTLQYASAWTSWWAQGVKSKFALSVRNQQRCGRSISVQQLSSNRQWQPINNDNRQAVFFTRLEWNSFKTNLLCYSH